MSVKNKARVEVEKPDRAEIIRQLRRRDGDQCMYPACGEPLDFGYLDPNSKLEPTIDHWVPRSWAILNGWTYDQIWALSNLKLMTKKCNAKKGSVVPNPDGTLPSRITKKFRYRRDKRAQRPEICTSCEAGRKLGPDEICASCMSGPMPHRWPRWCKVPSKDCLHDGIFWCWACGSGIVPMPSALEMIMIHGEGGDE